MRRVQWGREEKGARRGRLGREREGGRQAGGRLTERGPRVVRRRRGRARGRPEGRRRARAGAGGAEDVAEVEADARAPRADSRGPEEGRRAARDRQGAGLRPHHGRARGQAGPLAGRGLPRRRGRARRPGAGVQAARGEARARPAPARGGRQEARPALVAGAGVGKPRARLPGRGGDAGEPRDRIPGALRAGARVAARGARGGARPEERAPLEEAQVAAAGPPRAQDLGRGGRDRPQAVRGRLPRGPRPLGGRPRRGVGRRELPGDARRALDEVPADVEARRPRLGDGGGEARRDGLRAAGGAVADADVGPGRRDGALEGLRRRHRLRGLLLRPALPVAARDQREHQRARQAVLPQGDGLLVGHRRRGGGRAGRAQRQAEEDAGVDEPRRGDGGAAGVGRGWCNHRVNSPKLIMQ